MISADPKAIGTVVRKHLPEAKHQRCPVHFERNVLVKAPKRLRKRVAKELSEIFKAPTREKARTTLTEFAEGLGRQVPEALECLRSGFAAGAAFCDFPPAHWRFIRTTNTLERLNREIRRRSDSVGAFPDRASAVRLITAVVLKATKSWAYKQYLNVKLLEHQKVKKAA